MDNVIVTAVLIMGSVAGAVLVINVIIPSFSSSSQTVVEAQRANAERTRTAIEFVAVNSYGVRSIDAWIKNVGTRTIEALDKSDIFIISGDNTRFDAITYYSGTGSRNKTWTDDLKNQGLAWETGETLHINIKMLGTDELSPGVHRFRISTPNGITAERAFEAGAIEPPSGLVSWWPGDGSTGDIIGTADGTLVGDATFASGLVGQGFSFDGAGYVTMPDAANLNITGDVTIDLWASSTATGTLRELFLKGAGAITGVGDAPTAYQIALLSDNTMRAGFESDVLHEMIPSTQTVTDSEFHHYAYVRKGSSHKAFLDGVEVANGTFAVSPGDTTGILPSIGATRHDPAPAGFQNFFTGVIDEVQVFNRALTDQDIRDIHNAGGAGQTKP